MTERKGKYVVRRVDHNQAEIVKALRQAGASVVILSGVGHGVPDLLVGYISPNVGAVAILMEVKQPGCGLTEAEREFLYKTWRGPWAVVHDVTEAMDAISILKEEE